MGNNEADCSTLLNAPYIVYCLMVRTHPVKRSLHSILPNGENFTYSTLCIINYLLFIHYDTFIGIFYCYYIHGSRMYITHMKRNSRTPYIV